MGSLIILRSDDLFLILSRPNLTLSANGTAPSSPQEATYDIDLGPVILVRCLRLRPFCDAR